MNKDTEKEITALLQKIEQQSFSLLQMRKEELKKVLLTLMEKSTIQFHQCKNDKIYLMTKKQNYDGDIIISIQDFKGCYKEVYEETSLLSSYTLLSHYHVEEHDYNAFKDLEIEEINQTYYTQKQIEKLPLETLQYVKRLHFEDEFLTVRCLKECIIDDLKTTIYSQNILNFANLILKNMQSNLIKLKVEFHRYIGDLNLTQFAKLLNIQTLESLSLNFSDSSISNQVAKALSSSISKLIHLNELIIKCSSKISSIILQDLFRLSEQLSKLTKLEIDMLNSDFDSTVIGSIEKVIINQVNLKRFFLYLSGKMLDQSDYQKLLQCLQRSPEIQEIKIFSSNEFIWFYDKSLKKLEIEILTDKILTRLPNLEKHELMHIQELTQKSNSENQKSMMKWITQFLPNFPQLKKLNLLFKGLNLTEEKEEKLCKTILQYQTLKVLKLEVNGTPKDLEENKQEQCDLLINKFNDIDDVTIYIEKTKAQQQLQKQGNRYNLFICLDNSSQEVISQLTYHNCQSIMNLEINLDKHFMCYKYPNIGEDLISYINKFTNLKQLKLEIDISQVFDEISYHCFQECQQLNYIQVILPGIYQYYQYEDEINQLYNNLIRKNKRLAYIYISGREEDE